MHRRSSLRMTLLLGSMVAVAAVAAVVGINRPLAAKVEPEAAVATRIAEAEPESQPALGGDTPALLSGEVLETLAASRYTYLRLRTAAGEVWAAVPAATIALHSQVQIADAARMDAFKSTTLKRTFDVVYFGTLSGAAATRPASVRANATLPPVSEDQPLPPGHPDIGSATLRANEDGSDELQPGHPDIEGAGPFAK